MQTFAWTEFVTIVYLRVVALEGLVMCFRHELSCDARMVVGSC